MMENKKTMTFSEELRFLFETMCKELVDLKLSQPELASLFIVLCHFVVESSTKKYQLDEDVERELVDDDEYEGPRVYTKKDLAKLIENKENFNISGDIEQNFNKIKNSPLYKYKIPYFIKYFDGNDHLINVLNNYSLKYNFPQSHYEVRYFYDSLSSYITQLFAKGISHRIKESNSEGWSIKTDDGLIKIEDAAYVWDGKEGAFRFVTKNGNWGFVLQDSHEIIYLPNNIIQMEDFNCFRARVFINDRYNNELLRVDGYWGYIDLRGNIITNEKYEEASDFENNVATVSRANIVWEMGMDYCAKNPDSNLQIDVFGNITEESVMRRNEIIKDGEERRKKAEWNKMMYDSGMGDEEIIDAISNGNGDIFGY